VTGQQYEEEGIINKSIGDCFQAKEKVTLFPNPQYICCLQTKSPIKNLNLANLLAQQGSQLKNREKNKIGRLEKPAEILTISTG
jgi:hypothetical protein